MVGVAVPTHLVLAQSVERLQNSTGLDDDFITLIVQAFVIPSAGTLLAFWVSNQNKNRDNQWTALNISREQLLKDRDDAIKVMQAKDHEADALREEANRLHIEIANKDSEIAILKYRLRQYEPVTGEVPKE